MSNYWITLDRNPKTLEATTMHAVHNNIDFIRDWLVDVGYSPSALIGCLAQYNTQINQVRNELQYIENNLDKVNAVVESVYYVDAVTIGSRFTKEMYQRWYDILYDYKMNIIPENRGWAILELIDCIPTIDGKDIAIRGEEFGT